MALVSQLETLLAYYSAAAAKLMNTFAAKLPATDGSLHSTEPSMPLYEWTANSFHAVAQEYGTVDLTSGPVRHADFLRSTMTGSQYRSSNETK